MGPVGHVMVMVGLVPRPRMMVRLGPGDGHRQERGGGNGSNEFEHPICDSFFIGAPALQTT
jgi:hypothetical protein